MRKAHSRISAYIPPVRLERGPHLISLNLQSSVDKFGRSLEVPQRLAGLHPRKPGGSGDYAALAPAVTLTVIAAFEGFVEDFLATALYLQGHGLPQIAQKVSINNPTVRRFSTLLTGDIPAMRTAIGKDFSLHVWNIPAVDRTPATEMIDWPEALQRADGWMEVRHCLAHGLVSGWRSEVWPAPLKAVGNARPASSVLRAKAGGKHSIGLTGALSCARIYRYCAEHLTSLAAAELGEQVRWDKVAAFPLQKAVEQ
jgi:hypothetical protein